MKNLFYLPSLCLIASTALLSCNDSDVLDFLSTGLDDTVITVDSFAKLDPFDYSVCLKISPIAYYTRSTLTDTTFIGYTSSVSSGNRTTSISSTLANKMGIPYNKYYICEWLTLDYATTLTGLSNGQAFISYLPSPNCGLLPDTIYSTYEEIGYKTVTVGDAITLKTKVLHVICDVSGVSYNLYYPCIPSLLEWNMRMFEL